MYYRSLIAIVCLSFCVSPIRAQTDTSSVKELAQLVDDQTVAIARLNLDRFDAKRIDKQLSEHLGEAGGDASRQTRLAAASGVIADLKQAGVQSVFFILNMQDFNTGPVLVVPNGNSAQVQELLKKALPKPQFDTNRAVGSTLVFGREASVERVAKMKAVERPELSQAWAAAENSDAQILVLLTKDMRRVLKEVSPLPEQLRQSGKADAILGLEWAALGIKFAPLDLQLVVQSTDEPSAERAAEVFGDLIKEAAKGQEWLAKLAPFIQTKREGVKVTVSFHEQSPEASRAIFNPIAAAREAARRTQCINNFKQLAIAMHAYHDIHRTFPTAATRDSSGKPLLSWRVQLLPFVEQEALYKQFHLDEPWDSEHNKTLIEKMPAVFACPSAKLQKGMTTYMVPVGERTIFSGKEGMRINQIRDGTSNTIMLIEVSEDRAVTWTKPEDSPVDPSEMNQAPGSPHSNGFVAALADGSVRFMPNKIDAKRFKLLIDPSDGNPVQVP